MTPAPLTPGQRQALRYASRKGGAHIGTGKNAPDKHVTKLMAAKLVALGYAVKHAETLLTVKAGHAALNAPVHVPDMPVYLRERDGLTTRLELSVRDEDQYQDPDKLHPRWAQDAQDRHQQTQSYKRRRAA